MRRVTRGVAAALAVVLLGALAACSSLSTPTITTKPYTSGIAADLLPFYGQKLVFKDCGGGFQCGTAVAPLDWAEPGGAARVHLALIRHPATGTSLGTLFINPGGPGASGVAFLRSATQGFFDQTLLEHYDLVAWDPRGVGASSAVECTGTKGLDAFLFDDPNLPDRSAALAAHVNGVAKTFGAACAKSTGALLAHVDTRSTAADLDMLRADVGAKKLDYFGFSYGTSIGAEYADLFPTRVGRMVLDGAVDPTLSSFQRDLANQKSFGSSLAAYLAYCLKTSGCPFTGTVQSAEATLTAELIALRQRPIRAPDGRLVNSVFLRTAIDSALYDQASWPALTRALTEIRSGKTDTTVELTDAYVDRSSSGYTDNEWEAIFAVTCIDDPVATDPAVLARQDAELKAADPLGGSDIGIGLGDPVCANWPVKPTGAPHRIHAPGSPPILVLSTTGDPATPYAWGVSVAKQLPRGVLLTYRGQGHTAYRNQSACINTPVDDYFVTGAVPRAGIVCG